MTVIRMMTVGPIPKMTAALRVTLTQPRGRFGSRPDVSMWVLESPSTSPMPTVP